jgi:uncharacterized protein YbbC (DUF1343 family)
VSNYPLYKHLRKKESIGLLCNQSGWHARAGKYSFQFLADSGKLKKVFIPEHGLFGELQDQVKLDDTSAYQKLGKGIEWISLYSAGEAALTASAAQLDGIDTLVIDVQDAGSRYYTYVTTTWLLLKQVTDLGLDITVMVIDKPNPAGRIVEGTPIPPAYASFIGTEGLLHRHGLSIGELCLYFQDKLKGKWKLVITPQDEKDQLFISPSPNIPSTRTCQLYSGQCLWEGTNLSEGRGTTLPFETIGAPFLNWVFDSNWNEREHPAFNKHCYIRPLVFTPVFHKFANQACYGIHLALHGAGKYHSLAHSLQLIRFLRERSPEFAWRPGPYEAFNNRTAIELLVGDPLLLDYIQGKGNWKEVRDKLNEQEQAWIKMVKPFLLHKTKLQKLKLK